MKNSHKLVSLLLVLGGLGIIIAVFYLFLQEYQTASSFYLNLAISSLVYILVSLRLFDLSGSVENVAERSAGYGIKWYAIWLYAPLAIALVVCSILFGWNFKVCMIGQAVLLLFYLGFTFLGSVASANVTETIELIESRKLRLKAAAMRLDELELACRLKGDASYQESIDAVRAELRFVTPSENIQAVNLEEKLIARISQIQNQVDVGVSDPESILNGLKECLIIIEMRKKQY